MSGKNIITYDFNIRKGQKPKYKHSSHDESDSSPSVIVPILLKIFDVKSVVVGCGVGNWLLEFHNHKVFDVSGIDGSHLDRSLFLLETDKLLTMDLEKPISIDKTFGLAISLEVAEHISKKGANGFVRSLCLLSENIVFSAAIPKQGGQNHLNENWPSYWKQIFQNNGYHFYDILRPTIWANDSVRFWYKQNLFIATKHLLNNLNAVDIPPVIDFIHPSMLELKMQEAMNGEFGVKVGFKTLIDSIKLFSKQKFITQD